MRIDLDFLFHNIVVVDDQIRYLNVKSVQPTQGSCCHVYSCHLVEKSPPRVSVFFVLLHKFHLLHFAMSRHRIGPKVLRNSTSFAHVFTRIGGYNPGKTHEYFNFHCFYQVYRWTVYVPGL